MKLEVRDLECGYSSRVVQRFVNFTVESGEVCCVLGPNGCGKSTLFNTIIGVQPLLSGTMLVDGEDITRWSPSRMATSFAYVPQGHQAPFPYLVKDVVMQGRINSVGKKGKPTDADYLIAEQAMRDMGVFEFRDKQYTDISGGELQLVLIARALCQQPQLLILDEPTAALDYGNVVRVITKVRALAKRGLAVLMTTHSPDHAFLCNSSVLLLRKDAPARFGRAVDIITEKNMHDAYGLNVKIVEFVDTNRSVMRLCAPTF